MIKFIWSILLISLTISTANAKKRNEKALIPIPTPAQISWQEAELTALICLDLHVFDGKKYNQAQNRITPVEDINIFNPQQLDTDQWIKAVRDMGGKMAILAATHETGFALYQSDVNPYCMKALKYKDGKADIVRDFVNSCRKYGVQPGIYIGIRWNSFLGVYDFMVPDDGTQFSKNRQLHYNKMCEDMTEELMTRYGDIALVWYDGGGHGPELGGADVLPIVEKHQKDIIFYHNTQRADIRWGGSETGTVTYPCWGTYTYPYSHSINTDVIFKDNFKLLKTGDPNGKYYMPAMADAPLRGYNGRHEWFWEPGDDPHVFPLENLMNMYYKSVGYNATLILGLTPDDRGLIPDVDVKRIKEFGDEVKSRFGTPIATTSTVGNKVKLKLKKPQTVKHIIVQEDLTYGERIRKYRVEGRNKRGKWQPISNGSCVGHKHIVKIEPTELTELRLTVDESLDTPQIKSFAIY
jgi:alpha-L-fucosidase